MQGHGEPLIRRRLVCRGVVQGVGFRPAVHRLGTTLGLAGTVCNDAEGATIEVEGAAAHVAVFEAELPRRLPPLARLDTIEAHDVPPLAAAGFTIGTTTATRRGHAMVPPDAALCATCRAELDDPHDRRHRHPFATCTDCGPRFSLVHSLPYDRARTSMRCFPLCAACAAEYADPGSRRFHAEPVCCPDCGPRPWCTDAGGTRLADGADALAVARERLAAGAIVAIKGLGGFQLACRADDERAVITLRQRKGRATKPFAVMVRDLAAAHHLVHLTAADERLLASAVGPIVLLPRRAEAPAAAGIAPGLTDLGVMLPTTPLHVELFRGAPFASLVATSGNRSDEPICLGNREALQRLAGLADLFVLHDRDIVRRTDDSVLRASMTGPIVMRRSRGLVPGALRLPIAAPSPVLALGPHLQTTVCLAVGHDAFVSQHIGDLDGEAARAFHHEVAAGLEQFLDVTATTIACDTHPDYPSSWLAHDLAAARGVRTIAVPHHLAHAAAVLGEHGVFPAPDERATALVLDGTGHGPDGTAWGSELLQLDGALRWTRAGHGEALPLVGGEAAVREPWRIVTAALVAAGLKDRLHALPFASLVVPDRVAAVVALAQRPGWPMACGAGRLFEAAGALLGLAVTNGYEGEAAVRCEALAASVADDGAPAWPEVMLPPARDEVPQRALLVAAAQRLLRGEPPARVASGLHRTFAALWVALARRRLPGLATLALGGGCLANRLLRHELTHAFAAAGCAVRTARELPPGDGGIAFGQCVVAAVALARGVVPTFSPSRAPES